MSAEPEHRVHETNIYINGREVTVSEEELTFDQIVALSGMPTGPDVVFTISYRKGHGNRHEGSMVEGGSSVKVKKGMVFNVSSTNRS